MLAGASLLLPKLLEAGIFTLRLPSPPGLGRWHVAAQREVAKWPWLGLNDAASRRACPQNEGLAFMLGVQGAGR